MAEGDKALTRTPSGSSRKRTSSLGSHTDTQSSSLSSPEQDLHAAVDVSGTAAPAWPGPRSGSAPPERRSRMATFTCESMPIVSQVDGEGPSDLQAAASNVPVCTDEAPQDRIQAEPQIDKLLLDGLAVAKDRLLLLRADLEMEKLFNDLARTRLRVAPPGFPPNLNSYQRLLIHRLADMWSITRELEPASSNSNGSTPVSTANVGSMISGTIVLVKTEATKLPLVRIASLAPPSSPEHQAPAPSSMVSLVSKASELTLESPISKASLPARAEEPAQLVKEAGAPVSTISPISQPPNSAASTSSTSSSPAPASGPVRIMSRAANAAARAALNKSRSPSAGSGAQGMTFEEREAAYQQARMRIFNEAQKPSGTPVDQDGRSPTTRSPPGHENQQQNHQQLHQPIPLPFHVAFPDALQQAQYSQQLQSPPTQTPSFSLPQNPALRPSAPVFEYQNAPSDQAYQSVQGQIQQEHLTYYPVQLQPDPSLHVAPPIQVTMPSPAPSYAQQPHAQTNFASYPVQGAQTGFIPASAPFARPTSSHSQSSQSSISTATSQSSIRTASTSSAQRSTLGTSRGYTSPGVSLQPLRQSSTSAGPSVRQVRPTPVPSAGSSSARSTASVRSRHSQSSSSSPSVAGDSSTSAHVASSQTSKSASSSPDRQTGIKQTASPEEVVLASPHATLASRPDWIDTPSSSTQASSSTSSASSVSSKEHTSDFTEEHLSIQRDDAHTPLSSTSGKLTGRGLDDMNLNFDSVSDLASVIEDDHPDARSTPLPHTAPLPVDGDSTAFPSRSSRTGRPDTASQASSSRSSRTKGSVPNVIENPPLRYDKVKGWTMLNSDNLSQMNAASTMGSHSRTLAPGVNHHKKPPSPAPSVASSSNWSQHAFQSTQLAPSQQYVQLVPQVPSQNGYGLQHQQLQQQYVMMQVPVPHSNGSQQYYPQPGFPPQQQFSMQHGPSSATMLVPSSPQPVPQSMQMPYCSVQPAQTGQYPGQPVQIFYQPVQQMQPPPFQQGHGTFVPQQIFDGHGRGMTPAEMMANGEMLYSYDLPRPVPRSGATLFDPNASS